MTIDIVEGASRKPASTRELVDGLRSAPDLTGQLFVAYPIVGTTAGPYPIDGLLVSESNGIIVFDLVEGSTFGDYASRQDDSANKLEARLKLHPPLMLGRDLRIPIHTVSFAPNLSLPPTTHLHNVANSSSLLETLSLLSWEDPDPEVYAHTLSTLESISSIRHNRSTRPTTRDNSRGGKLKALEASIATLDNRQGKAVIETVPGVQRIRGLAGSGKTIVLALKAAYLHAQNPDWNIAVTFYTRSLKEHFRRLINNFSIESTGQEPNWDNLRIISAWGGSDGDGIYSSFCRAHGIDYLDFRAARNRFRDSNAFPAVCNLALRQVESPNPQYDAILVDEAQDFSSDFLRLCHVFLREPKRLVYAYDELQNLSEESLPSPEAIFSSTSPDGPPAEPPSVNTADGADIILNKCYRNSRPVLATAHALGFGIYREAPKGRATGLIQMFDNPQLWGDVGYRLKTGQLRDGDDVTLHRTAETSPPFLEEHSPIEDLVQFRRFETEEEQASWIASAIKENVTRDELRYDDIIVINPDPRTTRQNAGPIRRRLLDLGIDSHIAGVDTPPDVFFQTDQGSVTFTGIYRAKGNEAGMVYIINAQDCDSTAWNLATIRNRLFTAITRSKAWIRVLGVGSGMDNLVREYEELQAKQFELAFTYPTADQREQLRLVHRDMTQAEMDKAESGQRSFSDVVRDIEAGDLRVEDLDQAAVAKLRAFLDEEP